MIKKGLGTVKIMTLTAIISLVTHYKGQNKQGQG